MFTQQTLKTRFRFGVIGSPELRVKVKKYMDTKRIPYKYFSRKQVYSVDIIAKDQMLKILKLLDR